MKVKVSNVWQTGRPHVKVSGVWKPARYVWTKVAGVWKRVRYGIPQLIKTLGIPTSTNVYGYSAISSSSSTLPTNADVTKVSVETRHVLPVTPGDLETWNTYIEITFKDAADCTTLAELFQDGKTTITLQSPIDSAAITVSDFYLVSVVRDNVCRIISARSSRAANPFFGILEGAHNSPHVSAVSLLITTVG